MCVDLKKKRNSDFIIILFFYYLQTIEKGYSHDMGFQVVKLIVHFVHLIHDYGRKDLLDSYVKVTY